MSPQLAKPIAMGYVDTAHAVPGADLSAEVRLKPQPMRVVAMPFTPHRYHRG
jgi:aminomethyltransferase